MKWPRQLKRAWPLIRSRVLKIKIPIQHNYTPASYRGQLHFLPETLAVSLSQILGKTLSAARDIARGFDDLQQQVNSESGSPKLIPLPDRGAVEYIHLVGRPGSHLPERRSPPQYREQAVPSENGHVVA